jgi:hypothetical protein
VERIAQRPRLAIPAPRYFCAKARLKPTHMARKFLYLITLLVVMVIAGLVALNVWSQELTRFAFVPKGQFTEQVALEPNAYDDPDMWFSRPGIGVDDPSRWQPPELQEQRSLLPTPADPAPTPPPPFAVFFVHPTSFLDRSHWNAPLDDPESQKRARIFLQGMASPFSAASEIWAPRYRQATFGAFLTDAPEAQQALDAAYRDVELAFQFFLSSIDKDVPIVIAGCSKTMSRAHRWRAALWLFTRSAGRFHSNMICPRWDCAPVPRLIKQAASSAGPALPCLPIPKW